MKPQLLGQILASVVLGAIEAGHIIVDEHGQVSDPAQLRDVILGFLTIWVPEKSGKPAA